MSNTFTWLVFALSACFACGCGRTGAKANLEQAQTALKTVLEAWQKGHTPESLLKCVPPIHARDEDWKQGCKLNTYEILSDEAQGHQRRCKVKLEMADDQGHSVVKDVFYEVDTSPAIVVVRAFQ